MCFMEDLQLMFLVIQVKGCAYDCHFCSERRSVAGTLKQLSSAADRLFNQLSDAQQVVEKTYFQQQASAFVEDSLLLAGNKREMDKLYQNLTNSSVDKLFGAQLTIDQILARKENILNLNKVGLNYFFIGLETFDPKLIGGMSKDTNKNTNYSWSDRATAVFEFLAEHNIQCGAAILFGLDEQHHQRIHLLKLIDIWQSKFKMPWPVSMNWAVQHPLCGRDNGANYLYLDWETPGDLLDLFHDFGEASLNYPLKNIDPPNYWEVKDVHQILLQLNRTFSAAKFFDFHIHV